MVAYPMIAYPIPRAISSPVVYGVDGLCQLDRMLEKLGQNLPFDQILSGCPPGRELRYTVASFCNPSLYPSKPLVDRINADARIHVSIGYLPEFVRDKTPKERIVSNVVTNLDKFPKACALGKIGLDYSKEDAPRAAQKRVLHDLCLLARSRQLPVIVDCREMPGPGMKELQANKDCLEVMKEALPQDYRVYKFGLSSAEEARLWMSAFPCCVFGINGSLFYTSAEKSSLVGLLKLFDVRRLILETNSPYLHPNDAKATNFPTSVFLIAEKLASITGQHSDVILKTTHNTAVAFFKLEAGE